MKHVSELFVSADTRLCDVLVRSNETRRGIVLVVDAARCLQGVITDGDIRRAFLAGTDLDTSAGELLETKGTQPRPITASVGASHEKLVELLRKTGVSHIPLVNAEGQVEELVCMDELLEEDEFALQAVVMAGGRGTRLHPLTEDLPKPMLPIGDRPLMERIIRKLGDAGIHQVSVTTHFQAEKIADYFGDGQQFGVRLSYVPEDRQLGTAGGLSLLPTPESTLLVMNGDILTEIDFRAMLVYHRQHKATLTVGVRLYEFQVPYGVVESEGPNVRRVVEKPTHKFFVNAGIYLLEPAAHQLLPKQQHFDMTDLIKKVIDHNYTVVSFPIWEYWRDIGHHQDYVEAQADVKRGTDYR